MNPPKTIGIQIRTVSNRITRCFDSAPFAGAEDIITGTNTWLIAYIAEHTALGEEVFQRDIEESFGITRSTVSKVVKLMEKKGLVERLPVRRDARLKRLVLTDKASALAEEMRESAEKMEARLTAGFTEAELEQFFSYMERIQKNLRDSI